MFAQRIFRKCFELKHAKRASLLLTTCASTELGREKWNDGAGMCAKASISGVMLVVVPRVLGLCVFSPRTDPQSGVSAKAAEFCRLLVQKYPALLTFKP